MATDLELAADEVWKRLLAPVTVADVTAGSGGFPPLIALGMVEEYCSTRYEAARAIYCAAARWLKTKLEPGYDPPPSGLDWRILQAIMCGNLNSAHNYRTQLYLNCVNYLRHTPNSDVVHEWLTWVGGDAVVKALDICERVKLAVKGA